MDATEGGRWAFVRALVRAGGFIGRWNGMLRNGGAEEPVRLQVDSSTSATLALGKASAEKILQMRSQGAGVVGVSTGLIESADAAPVGVRELVLKLIRQDRKLVGRVMVQGANPVSWSPICLTC